MSFDLSRTMRFSAVIVSISCLVSACRSGDMPASVGQARSQKEASTQTRDSDRGFKYLETFQLNGGSSKSLSTLRIPSYYIDRRFSDVGENGRINFIPILISRSSRDCLEDASCKGVIDKYPKKINDVSISIGRSGVDGINDRLIYVTPTDKSISDLHVYSESGGSDKSGRLYGVYKSTENKFPGVYDTIIKCSWYLDKNTLCYIDIYLPGEAYISGEIPASMLPEWPHFSRAIADLVRPMLDREQ